MNPIVSASPLRASGLSERHNKMVSSLRIEDSSPLAAEIFKSVLRISVFLLAVFPMAINIISCGPKIGQTVISRPDEFRHVYEANEKVTLKAIAQVFRDKMMGSNIKIDFPNKQVQSDYLIQDDWRFKGKAVVKRLNWKETEVVISIVTEAKTEKGWEMRRLLEKEQYIALFDKIELQIYEEMSKIE